MKKFLFVCLLSVAGVAGILYYLWSNPLTPFHLYQLMPDRNGVLQMVGQEKVGKLVSIRPLTDSEDDRGYFPSTKPERQQLMLENSPWHPTSSKVCHGAVLYLHWEREGYRGWSRPRYYIYSRHELSEGELAQAIKANK